MNTHAAIVNLSQDPLIHTEFRRHFGSSYEAISTLFFQLRENIDPDSEECQLVFQDISQRISALEGNAAMCQLLPMADLANHIGRCISAVQENRLDYSQVLGEAIMLCLDCFKENCEYIFNAQAIDEVKLNSINGFLRQIASDQNHRAPGQATALQQLISYLTGEALSASDESPLLKSEIITKEQDISQSSADTQSQVDELQVEQLDFFKQLCVSLESRLPHWKDRAERMLPICLKLNEKLDSPLAQAQITAAVYIHDASLAYYDDNILSSHSKLSDTQTNALQNHPQLAAQLILYIPGWEDAARMVLEHHERWDGSGYPQGLKENEICLGAQILALADTFESITHVRPDRQHRRSLLRALSEINRCSGTQFSPQVSSAFIEVIKEVAHND